MATVTAVVAVTTCGLSSSLVVPAGRIVAAVAAAAIPALVAGCLTARLAAATFVLSTPVTLLAAGMPVRVLLPTYWTHLLKALGSAVLQPIAAAGQWRLTPALLAVLVLPAGALWTTGAALGAPSTGGRRHLRRDRFRLLAGFALLAAPWLTVLSLTSPRHSAWQGGLLFVAGILWFCDGRAAPALAVAAAVAAVALADAVGPSSRWFGLAEPALVNPPFSTLAADPTYGPLTQRRTGATMLVVTAPDPGLWRLQTLDYADGRWVVDGMAPPALPEPAARREHVRVRVIGLRENLAVAPGRIDHVSSAGKTGPAEGEGMYLEPMPVTGASYQVTASVVHATAAQLSRDRTPLSASALAYTRLLPPLASGHDPHALSWLLGPFVALLSAPRPPVLDPRVLSLARRLARGARTEWEIVTRVERYLLAGRWRYTTDVPPPGPQPLVDFLLRTHAGYCQHFAGAAALLLRLDGVPARVVTGFATGARVGRDRYVVRDVDAHDWVEVYFEGYGWVPFNPTPAADPALVAEGVDPVWRSSPAAGVPGAGYLPAALAAVLAVGALGYRRRARRPPASRGGIWRVAWLAGAQPGPSTTLAQVRATLATRIGPRTAAIADGLERARFAAEPTTSPKGRRIRLARALLGDLGAMRMLLLLLGLRPRGRSGPRRQR